MQIEKPGETRPTGAVIVDGGLDFLKLVHNQRVFAVGNPSGQEVQSKQNSSLVSIGMIVGENFKSLRLATLPNQPTG